MVKWKPSEPNHSTDHRSILISAAFHLHYNKQCFTSHEHGVNVLPQDLWSCLHEQTHWKH